MKPAWGVSASAPVPEAANERPLAAAASLTAAAAATASPSAVSGQAGVPAATGVEKVAAGSARSLGEPAAAPGGPLVVEAGTNGPPLVLPGASFYDFPAGDTAALPGRKLMVAAPFR